VEDPRVFLHYDQAALDAAYDQAAYAPNREQLIKRRIRDSELARRRIGEPERVAYGSAEIEQLDIYRAGRKLAPVFIFIHGGAWRSGRSKELAGPAEMFLAAGTHYVVPDFAWVQDVGGRFSPTRSAAPLLGCTRMPLVSMATPIGSISVANRLVGISPRSLRPIGSANSTCLPTSSRAACAQWIAQLRAQIAEIDEEVGKVTQADRWDRA
jgi:hypothetical protein